MQSTGRQPIKNPTIIMTIKLPDNGIEEWYDNGKCVRSWNDGKKQEADYSQVVDSKLMFKLYDNSLSQKPFSTEIDSQLKMMIIRKNLQLKPDHKLYISTPNKSHQPAGTAIGSFLRNDNEIKTIVYPDESYIEEHATYRKEVNNITRGLKNQEYRQIKTYPIGKPPYQFTIVNEDFASGNPIVEIMEKKNGNRREKQSQANSNAVMDLFEYNPILQGIQGSNKSENKEVEAITNQLQTSIIFSHGSFTEFKRKRTKK